MSSTSAPFGLRPIFHSSAQGARQRAAIPDGILSGYTSAIYSYQPVKMATDGTLQPAGVGDAFQGVFLGCEYTATDGTRFTGTSWTANTTYVAGTMIAYYTADPYLIYEIQATGSLAQTSVGDEAQFDTSISTGSSTTGFSQAMISTTLTGAGNTAQLRIVGLSQIPDNAWGDNYTVVQVQISKPQYAASSTAI